MKLLALLAALALALTACGKPAIIDTEALCKSWRHQTVSKKDVLTDGTASGIEGNNESRPAWGCAPGKDEAKS